MPSSADLDDGEDVRRHDVGQLDVQRRGRWRITLCASVVVVARKVKRVGKFMTIELIFREGLRCPRSHIVVMCSLSRFSPTLPGKVVVTIGTELRARSRTHRPWIRFYSARGLQRRRRLPPQVVGFVF